MPECGLRRTPRSRIRRKRVQPVLQHIKVNLAQVNTAEIVHVVIDAVEEELLVRYRIDGILHDAMTLPKHAAPTISARIKVLSNLKLDEKRLPQDGRFKMDMNGQKVSFRVSIAPLGGAERGEN